MATPIRHLSGMGASYPRQFWILLWGLMVSSIGSSMIFPFLTIYMTNRLTVPLTSITLLFTLNSAAGIAALSFTGPAIDRFGRKSAMLLSLIASALVLLVMSEARTYALWAALMAINGMVVPIYRIAADAMVADLVGPEQRIGAYALIRMGRNAGIAIGPSIGGFVAGASFGLAFLISAAAHLFFALLVVLAVRETLTRDLFSPVGGAARGGFGPVLQDRRFVLFVGVNILAAIPTALLFILLPVYTKTHFAMPEHLYGFIMATNALMVVFLQYLVTRQSRRFPHLPVLATGALLYGLGVGSVALGGGFWGFWLSMVILTFGELLLEPTSTAMAASMAPVDMRGRYMGLFGLAWRVAMGIGPVFGGLLSDHIAPVATWYGGGALGLLAAAGFLLLARTSRAGAQGP